MPPLCSERLSPPERTSETCVSPLSGTKKGAGPKARDRLLSMGSCPGRRAWRRASTSAASSAGQAASRNAVGLRWFCDPHWSARSDPTRARQWRQPLRWRCTLRSSPIPSMRSAASASSGARRAHSSPASIPAALSRSVRRPSVTQRLTFDNRPIGPRAARVTVHVPGAGSRRRRIRPPACSVTPAASSSLRAASSIGSRCPKSGESTVTSAATTSGRRAPEGARLGRTPRGELHIPAGGAGYGRRRRERRALQRLRRAGATRRPRPLPQVCPGGGDESRGARLVRPGRGALPRGQHRGVRLRHALVLAVDGTEAALMRDFVVRRREPRRRLRLARPLSLPGR
jgi:hypothetical protein